MRVAQGRKTKTVKKFEALGLAPQILRVLEAQNITTPTPIQTRAIPEALAGRDVMGLAQTGTGKTAAFGLPIVQKLLTSGTSPAPKTARALILAPTRELARQISDALFAFTRQTHLSVGLVVGGQSMSMQAKRLGRGMDILVATPGRLVDHLERKTVRLNETGFLVLDEADQMLDMGFIHALRQIAPLMPRRRQTMLFSATMPKQMEEISQTYLNDPVRIEVSPVGQVADRITQSVHFLAQAEKLAFLKECLAAHQGEMSLVFCRTKYGCERMMKNLVASGFEADSIHGNKSQGQRDRALKGFKTGKTTILVATDVAARGIDIPGVAYVYNYEIPHVPENYVHRIGRTARAGRKGRAVAFCAPAEVSDFRAIEKIMKQSVPVASGTPGPEPEGKPKRGRPGRRKSGGGGQGGGQCAGQGAGQGAGRAGGGQGGAAAKAQKPRPGRPRRRNKPKRSAQA